MNRSNVRQKHRISAACLRNERSIRTGRDLEVEDVRSLALIEDEENLGEVAIAIAELQVDNLIDAFLQ